MSATARASALAPCGNAWLPRLQRATRAPVAAPQINNVSIPSDLRRAERRNSQRLEAVLLGHEAELLMISARLEDLLDALRHACQLASQPVVLQAAGTSPWGLAVLADLATALQPACFDADCARQKDLLLSVSLALPLLALVAAVAYLLRPPPRGSLDDGSMFADEETGVLFEAPPGAAPERDRRGELAFRPISYTPWPVEEGVEGERLRIDVGVVGERSPRTFVFSKVLPQPSQLVLTTLDRPLGIVFEEDARQKRAVVAGLEPGGHAEQLAKRARLNPALAATAPREGDVLRAVTATNIVYQLRAFGLQQPKRAIVVYGADGQGWPKTIDALRKGLKADGPVTLVLERMLWGEEARLARLQGGANASSSRGQAGGAAAAAAAAAQRQQKRQEA